MLRLSRKALLLFGIYATILAAVVVAGFLGQAVGIWAAILWGVGSLIGVALVARRRLKTTPNSGAAPSSPQGKRAAPSESPPT